MAVVRARSAPPYGLFAAVALAVLCAGAAIVFYVMWSKQSADADKAMADRAAVGSEIELSKLKTSPLVDATDKNKSLLQQLNPKIDALQADLAKTHADLDRANIQLKEKETELASANLSVKLANEKMQATERDAQTTLGGNQTSMGEKDALLKKLEDDLTAAKTAHDQAVAEGEKKLNDAQSSAEQNSREYVLKLQAAEATISKLEQEVKDLRLVLIGNRKGPDVGVGESDGNIIRVDAAAGLAWITLTKSDRVTPGMTFTTYDPRTGVRFGTDQQALGNGSLEVIEPGATSSLCRITRTTKDRAVQAGDLISNLVYHSDKTRQFRFVITGDFDLDGDGISTAAERERIVRAVKAWGGAVDDNVTSQTDYLVQGKPPASAATVLNADAAATVPGGVVDERTKEQASYEQLGQDAKRLAIPVLNANRFLSMVGYYSTTVVRY